MKADTSWQTRPNQTEQGKFLLDQPVRFLREDLILPKPDSPLQDKYPDAEVDVPLRTLLQMTVSLSDNTAADILLRLAGGTKVVSEYIALLGVTGFHLQDGSGRCIKKFCCNTGIGLSRKGRCNSFAGAAIIHR